MTRFDTIDSRILQTLQRDGRISNAELASRVGLSASACLRRVQELERKGVIEGYRAVLNRSKLGKGFVAFVTVGLSSHTQKAQAAFERAMLAANEVRECHNVTGGVEYILRVEVSDLESYKSFHTDRLGAVPEVATICTYVVMDSPKNERN